MGLLSGRITEGGRIMDDHHIYFRVVVVRSTLKNLEDAKNFSLLAAIACCM